MIPKSISASSLELAHKCLASYAASSIDRGAGFGNDPALLGTTLHAALEIYTHPLMMSSKVWDLNFLLECFKAQYFKYFGPDTNSDWYKQGIEILTHWHGRPDQQEQLQDGIILSREIKSSFMVPAKLPSGEKIEIPLNYVIDRLDQVGDDQYRVVDYKSQRTPWSPSEMIRKIQPRIYGLAIQIEYKTAKPICVQYDYLRYDRAEIFFSRDDNADTWRWLKQILQLIIDTDRDKAPATLNDGCRYCIIKQSCPKLKSNVLVGGVFAHDIDGMADTFGDIVSKIDGLKAQADEIEIQLLRHAQENELFEWQTENSRVKVQIKTTRRVNVDRLTRLVGADIARELGSRVVLGDLEKLRKDPRLSPAQKSMLETTIDSTHSEPSIKITPKGIGR